jgi:hypothetical protein
LVCEVVKNSAKIMKALKNAMFAVVGVALAMAMNASAGDSTVPNPYFAVLSGTTAAELPAKSAELVAKADAQQRQQTTIDVVNAAVPLNPAAAPAIVGSIAQSAPEMAAIAAATAVGLVPNHAAAIARAAAAAAPKQAGRIVEAICRVLPAAYVEVAEAVADVVPGAGKEILAAIPTAIPALNDSFNKVLASYNGKVPSVSTVLIQVQSSVPVATVAQLPQSTFASPALAGPTPGPPFVPTVGPPFGGPPANHQNLDPGSGGQVTSRDYSAPVPP